MTCVKDILTEGRDMVIAQLKSTEINPVEKLQYKLMAKNLNGMLNFVVWVHNIHQTKKAR